jgi:transposase
MAAALKRKHGISVSRETVRRDLRLQSFSAKRMPKGPQKIEGDQQIRIHYAKVLLRHKALLKDVAFSDEKLCTCDGVSGWDWTKGTPLRRTVDQNSSRMMIWGVIGVGMRHFVVVPRETKIDAAEYVKLLESAKRIIGKKRIFMQDNARSHNAVSTIAWLKSNGIRTMMDVFGVNPPARSSDLNPIEQIWAIVSRRVAERWCPITYDELKQAWETELANLEQSIIDDLVLSFRSRLEKVIAAKGETITP